MPKKAKRGRPRGVKQDAIFQMRASKQFLRAVDEWRRKQTDLPPRSEAIRRLVEQAIGKAKGG